MVNWTLDGSANNASGSLNGSSLVGSQFSLDMQVDPDSSTASPVVGDWTFSIVSGGTTQRTYSGTGRRSAMTFTNVTVNGQSTRRYTMVLGAITGTTGAPPAVSQLQLTFLAGPNGSGGFLKFGQSLTFAANQTAGSLSMVANSPFGMLSTPGFTAVPSPGAVALLGAAGFFVSRRRGQAA
jgi:MYXO-CTERM domain-containing protein